ncbi:MAG: hypothetical protein KGM91_23195 [Burkholderiales bacterium]|nr:hypothetical protein [Burkholderiales bacterium]
MKTITAAITATEAELQRFGRALGDKQIARAEAERSIGAAQGDFNEKTSAYHSTMASEALGEASPADVSAARAAVAAADKVLTAARKAPADLHAAAEVERLLAARIADLNAKLAGLKQQAEDERIAGLVGMVDAAIAKYTNTAQATVAALAELLALDDYLRDLGKPQDIHLGDTGATFLPSFRGAPAGGLHFGESKKAARARLIAEHGQPAFRGFQF